MFPLHVYELTFIRGCGGDLKIISSCVFNDKIRTKTRSFPSPNQVVFGMLMGEAYSDKSTETDHLTLQLTSALRSNSSHFRKNFLSVCAANVLLWFGLAARINTVSSIGSRQLFSGRNSTIPGENKHLEQLRLDLLLGFYDKWNGLTANVVFIWSWEQKHLDNNSVKS